MAGIDPFLIVGLGEVLWDLLPDGKQLGGSPANVAYYAQLLGGTGAVISAAGRDPLGRGLLSSLEGRGLSTRYISEDASRPTGVVSITLTDRGQPAYVIDEDVAWDHIPFNDASADLARNADAICFGTMASRNPHSQACIQKLLDTAMPGCLRVFDVNLREQYYSRELLETLLEHTEVLKLNEDELPVITGLLNISGSTKERMEALLNRYALDAVALTRAARGSVLLTPGMLEVHHGVRVDGVVDTVGAGDAYTAVLVTGLLHEWPVEEISDRANQLAAQVCMHAGAIAPYQDQVKAAL